LAKAFQAIPNKFSNLFSQDGKLRRLAPIAQSISKQKWFTAPILGIVAIAPYGPKIFVNPVTKFIVFNPVTKGAYNLVTSTTFARTSFVLMQLGYGGAAYIKYWDDLSLPNYNFDNEKVAAAQFRIMTAVTLDTIAKPPLELVDLGTWLVGFETDLAGHYDSAMDGVAHNFITQGTIQSVNYVAYHIVALGDCIYTVAVAAHDAGSYLLDKGVNFFSETTKKHQQKINENNNCITGYIPQNVSNNIAIKNLIENNIRAQNNANKKEHPQDKFASFFTDKHVKINGYKNIKDIWVANNDIEAFVNFLSKNQVEEITFNNVTEIRTTLLTQIRNDILSQLQPKKGSIYTKVIVSNNPTKPAQTENIQVTLTDEKTIKKQAMNDTFAAIANPSFIPY